VKEITIQDQDFFGKKEKSDPEARLNDLFVAVAI